MKSHSAALKFWELSVIYRIDSIYRFFFFCVVVLVLSFSCVRPCHKYFSGLFLHVEKNCEFSLWCIKHDLLILPRFQFEGYLGYITLKSSWVLAPIQCSFRSINLWKIKNHVKAKEIPQPVFRNEQNPFVLAFCAYFIHCSSKSLNWLVSSRLLIKFFIILCISLCSIMKSCTM